MNPTQGHDVRSDLADAPELQVPTNHFHEVYTSDFTHIVNVPDSAVHQLPPPRMNITRFVACKNFSASVAQATEDGIVMDEEWLHAACPMDTWCRFAHISKPLSDFPQQPVHAHYIWRSVEEVTYERLWTRKSATEMVPRLRLVAADKCRDHVQGQLKKDTVQDGPKLKLSPGDCWQLNERATEVGIPIMIDILAALLSTIRLPATRLLRTAGAEKALRCPKTEIRICQNYTCENECRLGDKCPDAHIINLDNSQINPFVRRSAKHVKKTIAALDLVEDDSSVDSMGESGCSTDDNVVPSAAESEETTSSQASFEPHQQSSEGAVEPRPARTRTYNPYQAARCVYGENGKTCYYPWDFV